MNTHDTYTIARFKTRCGKWTGWRLKRLRGATETTIPRKRPFSRDAVGLLLPERDSEGFRGDKLDRALPTYHGSLDHWVVFEPAEDAGEPPYLIVLVESGQGLYHGVSEYAWTVAGWKEVNSLFLQTDFEQEEFLGSRYWELTDSTIARRLLEALHDRM